MPKVTISQETLDFLRLFGQQSVIPAMFREYGWEMNSQQLQRILKELREL